jgi:hypothetical protein
MQKKINLSNATVYVEEAYLEDRIAIAGAFVIMYARPYNYRTVAETWSVSKGQLDHVWASRERAFALSRLVYGLMKENLITKEDAEHIILEMDVGWHCPAHPLIPMTGPYDTCYACLDEAEAEADEEEEVR